MSLPASRCWRRRRATFSAPTTASSITTASATASPANEIALKVSPSSVEHERRRDERHRDRHERDQHGPPLEQEGRERQRQQDGRDHDRERQVVDRVLDEASPAGRRTCRSACRRGPASACRARPRRPSSPRRVLAPGNFSTTSIRPSLSLTTASPISGWWSSTTFDDVGQAQPAAGALDRHLAELGRSRRCCRTRCGPGAAAAASR